MSQSTTEEKKVQPTIQQLVSSDTYKKQFKNALPKYITPERYVRVLLTILTRTPKLQKCTQSSLMACFMDCAQMGLEPNGRDAHLIPYNEECKFIPDYKGLVKLARNSGEVSDIHADVVCENDEFSYSYGSDAHLTHKPALTNRGKVTCAYSFVKLKDGSLSFEVMNIEEIYSTRDRSEGWKAFKAKKVSQSPWETGKPDEKEMMKKTAFRRHSKWLPISSEKFHMALEKDFDKPDDFVVDMPTDLPEILLPKAKNPTGDPTENELLIGEPQQTMLKKMLLTHKISEDIFLAYLKKNYQVESIASIRAEWIADITAWMGENASA